MSIHEINSKQSSSSNHCCYNVISNIALIAGVALVVIGILVAAQIPGLQVMGGIWYAFELAALPCFIFKIIICCKGNQTQKTQSTSQEGGKKVQIQGQPPTAEGEPSKVIAAPYNNLPDHSDAEQLFSRGVQYQRSKRFDDALSDFEQAWEQGYALAGFEVALCYARSNNGQCGIVAKDHERSMTIYKALAEKNYLEALFKLTYDALNKDQWDNAETLLKKAIQIDSNKQRVSEIQGILKSYDRQLDFGEQVERNINCMPLISKFAEEERKKRAMVIDQLIPTWI